MLERVAVGKVAVEMVLFDVNVLVYAFDADGTDHAPYSDWLGELVRHDAAFGVADLVLSGFLRMVTHPKVFQRPAPVAKALSFVEYVRSQPHCVRITPGPRHWGIFTRLCRDAGIRGNLVPDAYLAALAIESGCEWLTADRTFARFPGLRWRHPLDS